MNGENNYPGYGQEEPVEETASHASKRPKLDGQLSKEPLEKSEGLAVKSNASKKEDDLFTIWYETVRENTKPTKKQKWTELKAKAVADAWAEFIAEVEAEGGEVLEQKTSESGEGA
jgi:hypothetical protein